jgi:acetyltransferase-like isoleucine patch superfamily enzyme
MLKKIIQGKLKKFGKNYQIDNAIPNAYFIYQIFSRLTMSFRGLVFLRKNVFLGSNTKILNKKNFSIGKNTTIENNVVLDGFSKNKIKIGCNVKIGSYSKLLSTSHMSKYGLGMVIGNNSAFGDFTHFGAPGGIVIGNDVIAGSYVSFHSENHVFSDTSTLIREQGVTSKGIIIGNNVWIGAKVTFLDGAKVGDNCVVAAGAVVNDQFPNNVVIGGVPAKILKEIQ